VVYVVLYTAKYYEYTKAMLEDKHLTPATRRVSKRKIAIAWGRHSFAPVDVK
jgi:hypothetical protein